MKLVSLNVWGASCGQILMDYIKNLSVTTDIFCLQEVFSSLPGAPEVSSGARMFLFEELSRLLPEFNGFFEIRAAGWDFEGKVNGPVSHGLAVFVKNNLRVKSVNGKLIAIVDHYPDRWVKAQVVQLESQGKDLAVVNFHGISKPGDKLDTPERLDQSKKLGEIWNSLQGGKILIGDFNLDPNTESLKMLAGLGKNLIAEFNIKNTRNEVSWSRHESKQMFADYAFTSGDIKVKGFEVPYNEVSDHLPMILEFEL